MSQENLEIVRILDAWNRRDEEALLALVAPRSRPSDSPTAIEPGTRHGTSEALAVVRHNGSPCAMAGPRSIEPTIAGRRSSPWDAFPVRCRRARPGSKIESLIR